MTWPQSAAGHYTRLESVESMNVLMTVVGGKIVYQRDTFKPGVFAGR